MNESLLLLDPGTSRAASSPKSKQSSCEVLRRPRRISMCRGRVYPINFSKPAADEGLVLVFEKGTPSSSRPPQLLALSCGGLFVDGALNNSDRAVPAGLRRRRLGKLFRRPLPPSSWPRRSAERRGNGIYVNAQSLGNSLDGEPLLVKRVYQVLLYATYEVIQFKRVNLRGSNVRGERFHVLAT